MQFRPRALPSQHGEPHEIASYNSYKHIITASLPYDLVRLHKQRDFLSMGLADCVTYLNALREKQKKNARQLNVEPPMPQKKRKRLQQTRRHLEIEIKNRERDEQAILNNLQACETNILLTNMKAFYLTNASVHVSNYTPAPSLYASTLCSHSESEATDLSWDGWTDDALISPFQKNCNSPFFVNELASEICPRDPRRDSAMARNVRRPPPLSRKSAELSNSLPVPPNTAQSQFRRPSVLSPEAAIFQPSCSFQVQQAAPSATVLRRLSMSSATATKTKRSLQKRRYSTAEIIPILQRFSIDARSRPELLPGQKCQQSMAQSNPHTDAGVQMSRQRTNSL